jgi:hypothetical protein
MKTKKNKTKQNKQTNISAGSHNKLKYFRARLRITGTVTNSTALPPSYTLGLYGSHNSYINGLDKCSLFYSS